MKIALIGYGKMGRAIEDEAVKRGHTIVLRADSKGDFKGSLQGADIAIEFTQPEAAVNNMYACFDAGIPVVVGTTGWYEQYETVMNACTEKNGTLFTATNYSIGVNLFFAANRYLAKLMGNHPNYKANIIEVHHKQKLDAPSGTAITTAEQLMGSHTAYKTWGLQGRDPLKEGVLPIQAIREDDVPGIHEVFYRSEIDEISLRHSAFSRKGFAQGAVLAAEWVAGKKGVFTMSDLLNF
ncbi:MAG TPA: 4-hydroxy-tetrahydrodipicolinate reductase [Bacteroidia bacterium]|nr:4-hydroxy-tetrahydrodipicolinate reductase [Bacteroidia bacterium]